MASPLDVLLAQEIEGTRAGREALPGLGRVLESRRHEAVGRLDEAEGLLHAAIEEALMRYGCGPGSPELGLRVWILADFLTRRGDHQAARPHWEEALAACPKARVPLLHVHVAKGLAECLLALGDAGAARERFSRALEVASRPGVRIDRATLRDLAASLEDLAG